MSQIIKASFDNVDSAAYAINDVRARFGEGVFDAKLKYHNKKEGKTDYLAAEYFAPADMSNPAVMNGMLPAVLPGSFFPPIGQHNEIFEVPKKATVEIVVSDEVSKKACSVLRNDGGLKISVK